MTLFLLPVIIFDFCSLFWFSSHFIPCNSFFFCFFFFCNFALAGAIYKLLVHCNRGTSLFGSLINWAGTFQQFPLFLQFLSSSLIFSHFLGSQTPSEDYNSEDEWLAKPPYSLEWKAIGQGIQGKLRVFHVLTKVFSTIYGFVQTSALIPLGCFE